jgi:hypothetical protein
MEGLRKEEGDLFKELGLSVATGEVAVGETYPIFGMITKVIDSTPGQVAVELNFNIRAHLRVSDEKGIETLKERVYESGIFISRIIAKEPSVEVDCQTVIFGKRQAFNA